MRVAAPDRPCVQVDGLSGRRYTASGGHFEMSDRDGRALVAAGGFVPSLAGPTRAAVGFRCGACGFGAFTRRCGRCGADCEREVPHAQA